MFYIDSLRGTESHLVSIPLSGLEPCFGRLPLSSPVPSVEWFGIKFCSDLVEWSKILSSVDYVK